MSDNEHTVLSCFNMGLETSVRCYNPRNLNKDFELSFDEDTIVSICRKLHAKKLIDEITTTPSDPRGLNTCYRISEKGIDKLNPNSREKKMFKMQKLNTVLALFATAASVITVVVVLTQLN